jgi:protein-disulfide isomerase
VGPDAYWRFSQSLYANQSDLGPDRYATLAEEVGADPQTVRTAAVEQTYETTVRADRQRGDELGVDSTPTVFVDGTAVGGYGFDAISQAIEDAR